MAHRLRNSILLAGGLAASLGFAGYVEPAFGSRRIRSGASFVVKAVKLQFAIRTNGAAGCDLRAYNPSIRLMQLQDRIAELRAQSRIAERAGRLERWETPHGVFWVPVKTDLLYVLAEQVADVYEAEEHYVRPGDTVLDCGANVGVFTRKALDRGAALVVAIEPVPDNVEGLRQTFVEEIAAGKVIVAPVGVWDKDDSVMMTLFDNSVLDSFVMRQRKEEDRPKRTVPLPLTTIDNLVSKHGLRKVDFIKMDVEGAERNALAGAAATIRNYRPRLSIATENLDDDYLAVPGAVRTIAPEYAGWCGACRLTGIASARPDIMFFSPRNTSSGVPPPGTRDGL